MVSGKKCTRNAGYIYSKGEECQRRGEWQTKVVPVNRKRINPEMSGLDTR